MKPWKTSSATNETRNASPSFRLDPQWSKRSGGQAWFLVPGSIRAIRCGGGLVVMEVWWSGLVFGSRLDPCHDLLEFIGQSGTGSHWPSLDRWRPQIGCAVVGTFPR